MIKLYEWVGGIELGVEEEERRGSMSCLMERISQRNVMLFAGLWGGMNERITKRISKLRWVETKAKVKAGGGRSKRR